MNAPTNAPTKRTRAVDVQVPGAAPVLDKAQDDAGPAAVTNTSAVIEIPDMEELKAQLKAQARAEVLAELAENDGEPLPVQEAKLGRGSYRHMRAADIDHAKLTAPVMTLDGWLCPPAPEKKA